MKLNELLNDNINEINYWYKRLREEFNKENTDMKKMKVIHQNIEDFAKQADKIRESYRTLFYYGLMSDKTCSKYEKEIQNFYDDVYEIRRRAFQLMELL